jgi:hypothetical protein
VEDDRVAHSQEPRVADGDPVRVAGQVLEDQGRPAERRIGILPIITVKQRNPLLSVIPIIRLLVRPFSCAGPRRSAAFAIFGW